MHPDWARSLRDECQGAGVPFFFKQWGEYVPVNEVAMPVSKVQALRIMRPDGSLLEGDDFLTPETVAVWRAGKAVAGRLLDGVEWNQFPVTA
jgi:protein gp37